MKKLFTILVIGMSISISTFGQEIETLWDIDVTTASKSAEKISDAPGVVSVITRQEIEGFGSQNLYDILNRATSMYMLHAGTFMWNVGSIRGQNISMLDNHVLILLNGRPYRDGMSGGFNNITYLSFPIETIDHIEIIRGPGSVLYGTNAYAGVINIITRKAEDESSFGAGIGYGSYEAITGSLNGGVHVNDDLNINFGLHAFDDKGPEFEFTDSPLQMQMGDSIVTIMPQTGKGNFTRDNKSVFFNLNYKDFHFNTIYSDLVPYGLAAPFKWDMNTQPHDGAGTELTSFKRYFADLGYTLKFNDKYSLDANFTYNRFLGQGWVRGDNDPNATKGITNNPILEMTFNAKPNDNFNIVLGGVYDYNKFGGSLVTEGELKKIGLYAQADYRIKKVKFIAGAQLNKVSGIDADVSPRLGIVANFNDNWGIKALYSTAFRNAYPMESYVNHPSFTGNPNLKPELIGTFDGQLFFQNDAAQASLTIFKSHLSQLINRVPNPDAPGKLKYDNVGTFDFSGVEFEGKYAMSDKLSLFASLTYQSNVKNDTLSDAAYWPKTLAKGGLLYTGNYWDFGIWDSYFGEPTQLAHPIVRSNPKAEAFNDLSANITFKLSKLMSEKMKFKIFFSIYGDNLLNTDPSWYPEFSLGTVNSMPLHPGRSINGKISVQF